MDSILGLSGQLMGLWLAIVGIAIVFGILHAIGTMRTKAVEPDSSREAAWALT